MLLRVPELGDDFREAKVVKWLVKEGDLIKKEQDLVELVTDKACFVVASPVDGVLKTIFKEEGQIVGEDLSLAEIQEDA